MKLAASILSCSAILGLAPAALAIDIDFSAVEPSADGAASWSYETPEGITVKLEPGSGSLSWQAGDGFLVSGRPGGESSEEWLTVTFWNGSEQVEVVIESFGVSDLMRQDKNFGNGQYKEVGRYQVDDGKQAKFKKGKNVTDYGSQDGTGTIVVDTTGSTLTLTSMGNNGPQNPSGAFKKDHDYYLSGLSFRVQAVPELDGSGAASGLSLLVGVGLVLGGWRKRRLPTEAPTRDE